MKNLLILLCLFLTNTSLQARDLYFKHLGIADGLSQTCILSIYQDERGAMWFGTSEGLNRYNGTEIKIYQPSQSDSGLTNNEINSLCGDKNGHIYILSGNDLVVFDLYKERFTCIRQKDVRGVFHDDKKLWVICDKTVYTYCPQEEKLTEFAPLPAGAGIGRAIHVSSGHVWMLAGNQLLCTTTDRKNSIQPVSTINRGVCLSEDHAGNVWVGTWEGLYRITPDKKITHFTHQRGKEGLADNLVRCILEDNEHNLWIGTFGGLNCYQPESDTWSHYVHADYMPNSLSHNSIPVLYKDNHQNIWVGTYYGGINIFTPNQPNKQFYTASFEHEDRLSFPFVGKMVEDDSGRLWICTEGGGLNRFDPVSGKFSRYLHQANNNRSIGHNNLKTIYYHQPNQCLYIGTHTGGLSILDIRSNTFRAPNVPANSPIRLSGNIVNAIQPYKDGLAILTQGGLFFLNLQTETFSSFSNQPQIKAVLEKRYAYETFLIDSQERMWLASSNGGVTCIELRTSQIKQFETDADDPSTIGKFKVAHIFEDSRGELYFGTIGSGLFKYHPQQHSFKVYNVQNNSLPNNYCYYIQESPLTHKLLLLHNKGLSIFNPSTETVEQTYQMFQQSYSQWSTLYIARDGIIYVGGSNGLATLPEEYLYRDPDEGKLSFEKLLIFNQEVLPDDETGILQQSLGTTNEIRLKHNQNHITVTFSTFSYLSERNNAFEYRFENLDKRWTQTSGNSITYTNIPPGNYTLHVRPIQQHADDNAGIKLRIHVAAPFYANPYAYTLYALLFAGILYLFLLFKIRQAQLQSSLEAEKKEKERIEELNQSKLRFFTNISHEFRTPLTLIIGQLEAIMQINKMEPSVYKRILRVYKNAWHMRTLITELLDFRKQEQGYLKLKVEELDLIAFTHEIYNSFYEYAQIKHINYEFKHAEETFKVWFDPAQMQKVIFNLLSNAFKYTPKEGSITVSIGSNSTHALITVSDTGSGIPEESIYKIFNRFYQADSTSSAFSLGTGIGLALAKGIMEAHHGSIDIKSVVDQGSNFTLLLPLGNQHFQKEDFATSKYQPDVIAPENLATDLAIDSFLPKPPSEPAPVDTNATKPVLLVVEDNEELLEMLCDLFNVFYEVHTARNGREGLAAVEQVQPDLIVSDVMMPEMSGKEMCYKLKNNVAYSHIPILLLTAQNSVEYIVEGYMFGADDYVTKPFNVKILLARCSNLIRNKQQLIAHYSNLPATRITESIPASSPNEKGLVENSITIIREHLDDPNFDVNALASALYMGRSKLYNRFKQTIGLTPNEFILKVRLDESMSLIKNNPELSISDVSTRIGFSSPRYFSKCFKDFFGIAPTAVRKKIPCGGNYSADVTFQGCAHTSIVLGFWEFR